MCNNPGNNASNDSETAFTLPGIFTTSVFPRTPAIPLDNMDRGVLLWPYVLMASDNPCISFSIIFLVASGVTSLGPIPVPPVVMTRSTLSSSQNFARLDSIELESSATTAYSDISKPFFFNSSTANLPDLSYRVPCEVESLMTRTAA